MKNNSAKYGSAHSFTILYFINSTRDQFSDLVLSMLIVLLLDRPDVTKNNINSAHIAGIMASALDTNLLNLAISKIIDNSKDHLIIVSPFLKLCSKIRDQFKDADRRGVSIIFVYGKKELDEDTLAWMKTLNNVYIGYSENLHAKYYANEEESVITSMNLYEYSQVNNYELGILLNANDFDRDTYIEQAEFVDKIIDRSEPVYATVSYEHQEKRRLGGRVHLVQINKLSADIDNTTIAAEDDKDVGMDSGSFCIRCGAKIPSNPGHYFCEECFSKWSVYKNPNYPEKYCHFCGKTAKTSFNKPSCYDCYPANKKFIEDRHRKY